MIESRESQFIYLAIIYVYTCFKFILGNMSLY